MRRFFVYFIPTALLFLFIFIMLSGNLLKNPIGKETSIPKSIGIIVSDINSNKWVKAYKETEKLSNTWQKIVNRVQFSSERDEINAFSVNLSRLRGAILSKDKSASFMELNEAYEHWDELGK
ncbi:hypothetical protein NL50_10870 [Clostridium acetobutylicum]|nr:hypothetical protein NL50_10870 [Clostridium acetobutylicum]